jgi:hypothetical protein
VSLAACLPLAGCLVAPPTIIDGPAPACRAVLRGTLWPPSDEPTFVVGRRLVTAERPGDPIVEVETDRRGSFELRVVAAGRYAVAFAADGHEAKVEVNVAPCSNRRVELVARRR